MKTLIIVALTFALLAATFLTRPTEASFKDFILQSATAGDKNFIQKGLARWSADSYLAGCQFRDRLLWVDVVKDGETVYTGAFSHWFQRSSPGSKAQAALVG